MPEPIRIDDDQNADWLHEEGQKDFEVLKGTDVVAQVKAGEVESSDPELEELLYQVLDEGTPNGESIPDFLHQFGYEVRE